MTGFITILTATVPAGPLPAIGHSLAVSETAEGQLVTSYAIGSLLATVPLVAATRNWRRRRVLLLAVG
jgi:predicted MFS family arabinose efflux permease